MSSYRLIRPLGRSSSADVWEAVGPDGVRVALKRTRASWATLRNEARATAALHHPGIVQVIDVVEVDGALAVVQELAPLGPLPRAAAGSWPDARDRLAEVLQALAHAHAQGVLHRDIKPANLLLFNAPPRLRLADFGVAHRLGEAAETVAGTWRTAAPEQIRGDALVPATDLYAVGCLGWLLTTGAEPFAGDADALAFAHQFSSVPAFQPVFAVPDGVEAWIRALLEKDPRDRPRLAADALAGLRALDPALPSAPQRRRLRPVGARLGALRRPDVHGRHAEKAFLVEALAELSGPRVVTLAGPPGSGKTALAEWLATRAHARGEAVCARMGDGVGALVAQALDSLGAGPALRAERVDQALSESEHLAPYDRAALLALQDEDLALQPAALEALLSRLLRHVARGRPLLWLVEDHAVSPALLERLGADPVLIVRTRTEPGPGDVVLSPLPDQDATLLLEDLAPLPPAEVRRLVLRGAGNPQLLVLLARDPVLPAGLRQAWRQRVLRLCPHPDALALAAMLGVRAEDDDWQAACAAHGVAPPDLGPLYDEGLLVREVDGFRFARTLAREALLDHPELAALRTAAAAPLLQRAERWLRTGNPTPAEAVLEDLATASLQGDARSTWCRLQGELARWRGVSAEAWAREAVAHAEAPSVRAQALHALSIALSRSEHPGAEDARQQALEVARAHGLNSLLTRMAMGAATRWVREGRIDEAVALVAATRAALPADEADAGARLDVLASWLTLKQGRHADAIALARRCRPRLLAAGERLSAYHSLTYEGDALRMLGDLDGAERCFAEAVALSDAAGTWSGAIARLNQGIVLLLRGDPVAAQPLLRHAVHEFQTKERATVELAARFWLLSTLTGPAWEECLARLDVLMDRVPGRDLDVVEAARFATEQVEDARLEALTQGLLQAQ